MPNISCPKCGAQSETGKKCPSCGTEQGTKPKPKPETKPKPKK
jgi:ribosomal protein L32